MADEPDEPSPEEPQAPGEETAEPEEESAEVPAAGPEVADGDTVLQPCTHCETMLDVGDLEPFAKVNCPICGTTMRVRTQLKHFKLIEVLGAGGMGAVYKAMDTNLNRMVALKVVRKEYSADAGYLAKFEREARITASVSHPNVVKVYSFGSDHGLFYIAMELVDKGSLDDLMNLQGRVAEIQGLSVGIQVAQGLQAANQKGLIHRDVKPGNILFADAQTAKIVDFGLALLAEHEAEERGEIWGTPYYVAPEKLEHQPEDFRSDMYSLGGTLFHAIAGRPPFEASTASLVALKHLKSRPVSLQAFAPDVSSATAYVINRTLQRDPEKRYASYAELIEHLEYARRQLMEAVNKPRRPKQRVVIESKGQQSIFAGITVVLILMILGVAAAIYVYRGSIFGHQAQGTVSSTISTDDPEEAARQMHDQLELAHKQMVAGDDAGALKTLAALDDESQLTQPFQNWITFNQGLADLLAENLKDAQGWFRTVAERSHFSTDPADKGLVEFFSKVGNAMMGDDPISPSDGTDYALDSEEALAPLVFALKDWDLGQFEDAGGMFALYLSSTPKDTFQWVAAYMPIAQQYADNEAEYEKITAAVAAADTPRKRAAAMKEMSDLKARARGILATRLSSMEDDLGKKSALLDPIYNQQLAQDQTVLADAKRKYAAACADMRFDEAQAAVQGITVSLADSQQQKDALSKKAGWLLQFKAQLIQDINASGYPGPLVSRDGAKIPDGKKKATDVLLFVEAKSGSVAVPWNSLAPSQVLAMSLYYLKPAAAPQEAADREWLAGVFACEEGLAQDGHKLLAEAAAAKNEYKSELGLFQGNQ